MAENERFHHYEVTPAGGWHGASPHEVQVQQAPFNLNVVNDNQSVMRRRGVVPCAIVTDATYNDTMELVNIFPYYNKEDRQAEMIVAMWNPTDNRLYWFLVRHNGSTVVSAIAPSSEASGSSPTGFVNAGGTDSQGLGDGAWQQSASYDDALYIGAVHTDADPVQHNVRKWDGTTFTSMPDDVWETDFETQNQEGFPRSRYMQVFQRHMVVGYTEEGAPAERYPGRLRWSHPDAVEYWHPDDWVQVGDNAPITGLYALRDILLIFKSNAVYGMYGSGRENWSIQKLSDGHGIAWGANAVVGEHAIYFWTNLAGLHAYDGNQFHNLMEPHLSRLGLGREIDTEGSAADLKDLRNVRLSYSEGMVFCTIAGNDLLTEHDPVIQAGSTVESRNLIYHENRQTMSMATYATNGTAGTYRGFHEIKEIPTEQSGRFVVGAALQKDATPSVMYMSNKDILGESLDALRDVDWCYTGVNDDVTAAPIPNYWSTPWMFVPDLLYAPHRWGRLRLLFTGHDWDSYYDLSGAPTTESIELATWKAFDFTSPAVVEGLQALAEDGTFGFDYLVTPLKESGHASEIAYTIFGCHSDTAWEVSASPALRSYRWDLKNFQVNVWPRHRGRT